MKNSDKWSVPVSLIIIYLFFSSFINPFQKRTIRLVSTVINYHWGSGGARSYVMTVNTIPFNFQVKESEGKIIIYVINGYERLLVDNIRRQGDSFFIEMPFFDSHFALRILNDEVLEGNWIKNYGNRQVATPFRAIYNIAERYPAGKCTCI